MMYSCAVFERPTTRSRTRPCAKLDRLARLLELGPGRPRPRDRHRLGRLRGPRGRASYGCHVTTTTISAEQHEFATRRVREAGLDDLVTVLADDYRDLDGTFDKVVAIEMIEAVDWREYDTFFAQCARLLDRRRARSRCRRSSSPTRASTA